VVTAKWQVGREREKDEGERMATGLWKKTNRRGGEQEGDKNLGSARWG